jgi:hypothetical protein
MTEAASAQPLRELITDAMRTLDDAFGSQQDFHIAGGDQQLTALATALRAALTVLAASVGECQVSLPYAGIQLVRHPDGSREWCCSHTPPHCDPA